MMMVQFDDRDHTFWSEWIREGRVPLQTIGAKIDYCSYTVQIIYQETHYFN